MARQELRYGLRSGKPSGWGYAMVSVGLGAAGLTMVALGLIVLLHDRRPTLALVFNAIPLASCLFCGLAPLGVGAGALVLDERLDVVRRAKLGIVLNLLAFFSAMCVSYGVWRQLDFD